MRKWIKVANEDAKAIADLLKQIAWETQTYGGLSYSALRAYAKGYKLKPRKLENLIQQMLDMKLITVSWRGTINGKRQEEVSHHEKRT
jgi:hypothetical protein